MTSQQLGRQVMSRAEVLGMISDEPGHLSRLAWSPAMRRANNQVARWMRKAGMAVREDAIGNLIGRYPAQHSRTPSPHHSRSFLLGSHLDTVRDAGKYDGILGVLVAIACVQKLHREKRRLPFALEVIGFADEEGVRFQSGYLGSGALTGSTTIPDLKRLDAVGISLAKAIRTFGGNPARLASARRSRDDLLGYAEVHIEQGPVLESRNLTLGVVTDIVGITRAQVSFHGCASHAGTTPMNVRRDALCAAAEFALAVEKIARSQKDLVATVGELRVAPGAVNVVPGDVALSLDMRHADDARRRTACLRLRREAGEIARKRNVRLEWQHRAETGATPCAVHLTALMKRAATTHQLIVPTMVSGAGHDAAEMARIAPVTMLFVRCREGISHNPAESVRSGDVAMAIKTFSDFLDLFGANS